MDDSLTACAMTVRPTAYSSVWALLLLGAIQPCIAAQPACLPSAVGSQDVINDLFRNGGSKTTVYLCPLSVHHLDSPIVFTSHEQTLTTLGDPKDWTRATLLVKGSDQSTAIKADCRHCNKVNIKSLIIDGNRPELLRIKQGDALVELGNAHSQTIKDCRILEPRGWSALHYREGDEKQCRGGVIRNNEIGPAGEEWDDDYDGPEKEGARWGNPRADGISLACMESLVDSNIVYDATDGAIVIFGSPGSEIKNNRVISKTRMIMGGINLVDIDPWDGDYSRTRVHHNTISAFGSYIKGGINVGMACWTDDTESIVHGGTVSDNVIEGDQIGYGITVASAKAFKVLRNKSTAKYSGFKGRTCPHAPENADPGPFIFNRGSSEGTFQTDFVNGEVQHAICIDPKPLTGHPYRPWRMRDAPEATKLLASRRTTADIANIGGQVDPDVADHIVSYQLELMTAMHALSSKIGDSPKSLVEKTNSGRKGLRRGREARNSGPIVGQSPFSAALADLSTRLANLEVERKQLRSMFETMQSELSFHNSKLWAWKTDQGSLLDEVLVNAKAVSTVAQSAMLGSTGTNATSHEGAPLSLEPSSNASGTKDVAIVLIGIEVLLGLIYLVFSRIINRTPTVKRTAPVSVSHKAPESSAGILIDRMADRLALDRPGNDTASLTPVGFGSTLKRENSVGRNRRRGTSGSGHGLLRDEYT